MNLVEIEPGIKEYTCLCPDGTYISVNGLSCVKLGDERSYEKCGPNTVTDASLLSDRCQCKEGFLPDALGCVEPECGPRKRFSGSQCVTDVSKQAAFVAIFAVPAALLAALIVVVALFVAKGGAGGRGRGAQYSSQRIDHRV